LKWTLKFQANVALKIGLKIKLKIFDLQFETNEAL